MKKIFFIIISSFLFVNILNAEETKINLLSESGIIMESTTGKVLFEKYGFVQGGVFRFHRDIAMHCP